MRPGRTILILVAATLSACGLKEPLQPPPGETLPPAPAAARAAPTSEDLLAIPTIARPERVDELLRRSEERPADRFDLPPATVPPGEPVVPPEARR